MEARDRYAPFLIKEYTYWDLYLNEKQAPYLGRSYAWWKDTFPGEGAGLPLSRVPTAALEEVFTTIFADMCRGLATLGYPTESYGTAFLLNTCYLANEEVHMHHMHVHFIPRSVTAVHISDEHGTVHIYSKSSDWGKNYNQPAGLPQPSFTLIERIRHKLAEAIG